GAGAGVGSGAGGWMISSRDALHLRHVRFVEGNWTSRQRSHLTTSRAPTGASSVAMRAMLRPAAPVGATMFAVEPKVATAGGLVESTPVYKRPAPASPFSAQCPRHQ